LEDATKTGEQVAHKAGLIESIRQVVKITKEEQLPGFAQMVAYNVLFATAPLLMVITAGASAITRTVNREMENPAQPVIQWLQDTLPSETAAFLQEPIEHAVNADIAWLFSVAALFALWGARGAVAAMIRGLNVAYGIGKDPRPLHVHTARSLGLTILLILLVGVGGLVFTLGTDVGDRIASAMGLGRVWSGISFFLRWPVIVSISVIAVMTLHRYGPAIKSPFKWYLPGSIFTVVAMYAVTLLLGVWFSQFGGFGDTYGIFGSVLAFVLWLFLMGLVLLVGGAINAVVHQRYSVESQIRS
jgi:membrane protein